MNNSPSSNHSWLTEWMQAHEITLWGVADLRDFETPKGEIGQRLPFAISWAIPMNPHIMAGILQGPNQAYADEYTRANNLINKLARLLADEIKNRGFEAYALAASERTDKVNIKGDFPHKTSATQAGIGWVGRHCQLITREFGSWIRLGTVFTNMTALYGTPIERSFCGRCMRCVEACPANALTGAAWHPALERQKILDVGACDRWKNENYFEYHQGHNCGICSSVCPYGRKVLTRL